MSKDCKTYIINDAEISIYELFEYILLNMTNSIINIFSRASSFLQFFFVLIFVYCAFIALKVKKLFTK